jgi:cytosine/adenosine deaminase-related metal-dependent hydrolase
VDEVNPPPVAWKSRWILCPERGALEDRYLVSQRHRLCQDPVRGDDSTVEKTNDFGDAIILPMPVNAHVHLDLSAFDEPIQVEGNFTDWLTRVVEHRRLAGVDSALAIKRGIDQLVTAGTRLVGDILASPAVDFGPYSNQLAGTIYREVIGLKPERFGPLLSNISSLPTTIGDAQIGVSPHAPYSTQQAVYQSTVGHRPRATHWFETREEREFLLTGEGIFQDFLERIGAWPSDWKPAVDPWRELLVGNRWTLIHANYLSESDLEFLASPIGRQTARAVVYCPRTHAHFGHSPHSAPELLRMGVPVGLGTDSLASNPDLDVWKEARWLADHHPSLSPREIFQMATWHGGTSIGRGDLGRLQEGALACLWVIEPDQGLRSRPWEAIFDPRSKLLGIVYRGEWIATDSRFGEVAL